MTAVFSFEPGLAFRYAATPALVMPAPFSVGRKFFLFLLGILSLTLPPLEFKTLIKSATTKEKTKTTKKEYVAPSAEPQTPPKAVDSKYQCILTEKDLDALIKKFGDPQYIKIDVEGYELLSLIHI